VTIIPLLTSTHSALKAELYKLASIPVAGIGRPVSQSGGKSQTTSPLKLSAAAPAGASAATFNPIPSASAPANASTAATIASSSPKLKPTKRKTDTPTSQAATGAASVTSGACNIPVTATADVQLKDPIKPPQPRAPKKPKVEGSEPVPKKAPKATDVKVPNASIAISLEQSNGVPCSDPANNSKDQSPTTVTIDKNHSCAAVAVPADDGGGLKSLEESSASQSLVATKAALEIPS
jgi:hypothetical protein